MWRDWWVSSLVTVTVHNSHAPNAIGKDVTVPVDGDVMTRAGFSTTAYLTSFSWRLSGCEGSAPLAPFGD
jgi:hypothetical protein